MFGTPTFSAENDPYRSLKTALKATSTSNCLGDTQSRYLYAI